MREENFACVYIYEYISVYMHKTIYVYKYVSVYIYISLIYIYIFIYLECIHRQLTARKTWITYKFTTFLQLITNLKSW